MRALVTGGAGFIGSHLCDELIARGYEVSIWDNLFRGKIDNIKEHLDVPKNHFFEIDMADAESIDQMVTLLVEEKPELIFHYAAINGTMYFYDIPAKVLETNADATRNLMLALRRAHELVPEYKCTIVYASSSEVYGEPLHLPSNEQDITYVNIESIRDSYAAAKLIGEFYVRLIAEELGYDFYIMRLFNVYGPKMVGTKYGQVIPEFITRLREGEYPLKIYGDGTQTRSFCYVTDNVKMTIDLAESSAESGVYNVGNPDEITIGDLAAIIMKKLDLDPALETTPALSGDHKRRWPDISKIEAAIEKRELINLSDGIDKMLQD